MGSFPFLKLPPELRNTIHFESDLHVIDKLALAVALSHPKNECALVDQYLSELIKPDSLVIQQTIHRAKALAGSYDWDSWAACKQALYDNPDLDPDVPGHAITFIEAEDAHAKAELVSLILSLCDEGCMLSAIDKSGDDFSQLAEDEINRFEEPSKTELIRVILSVYQFDAYRQLLNTGADDMSYEEAEAAATRFFRYLMPEEKEQIISIADMVAKVIREGICAPVKDGDSSHYTNGSRHFNKLSSHCLRKIPL